MKAAIIALLTTLLLTSTVQADTPRYRVEWTFTELTNEVHYEDYSTNLDIPLAATLPVAAVKANWSCIRQSTTQFAGAVILNGERRDAGCFVCSDGVQPHTTGVCAFCSTSRINTDHQSAVVKLPGADITFIVSCQTLLQ